MSIFSNPGIALAWTMTITGFGGMTVNTVAQQHANYYVVGSLCFIVGRATFNTAGVAAQFVQVAPPLPFAGLAAAGGNAIVASCSNGVPFDVGRGAVSFSLGSIVFTNLNNVNWTIGLGRGIDFQGFYQFR